MQMALSQILLKNEVKLKRTVCGQSSYMDCLVFVSPRLLSMSSSKQHSLSESDEQLSFLLLEAGRGRSQVKRQVSPSEGTIRPSLISVGVAIYL